MSPAWQIGRLNRPPKSVYRTTNRQGYDQELSPQGSLVAKIAALATCTGGRSGPARSLLGFLQACGVRRSLRRPMRALPSLCACRAAPTCRARTVQAQSTCPFRNISRLVRVSATSLNSETSKSVTERDCPRDDPIRENPRDTSGLGVFACHDRPIARQHKCHALDVARKWRSRSEAGDQNVRSKVWDQRSPPGLRLQPNGAHVAPRRCR